MNEKDVLSLLVYCNELDGRHAPNPAKVSVWYDLFSTSCPSMTLGFAQNIAKQHYARVDAMIAPNVFVREWRKHNSMKSLAKLPAQVHERHCRRAGCACTHDEPCYRGWIDRPDNTATSPCKICNPSLASVLAIIPPPGMRTAADFAVIDNRGKSE